MQAGGTLLASPGERGPQRTLSPILGQYPCLAVAGERRATLPDAWNDRFLARMIADERGQLDGQQTGTTGRIDLGLLSHAAESGRPDPKSSVLWPPATAERSSRPEKLVWG